MKANSLPIRAIRLIARARRVLYALQPNGALKWLFRTPAFAYGPPAVGADGSVYVASIDTLYALDSAGRLKWQYSDPGSQGAIAGPNIGPDGNIYVVNDVGGRGAVALSPNGRLLWNNTGTPTPSARSDSRRA